MMNQHLYILWTTQDPLTSQFLVLQYAASCLLQDWWDEVTIMIWGASAKLVAEDSRIQERIQIARHAGVNLCACAASARQLGVRPQLEAQGISVKGLGLELSRLMQEKEHLLVI